MSVNPQITDSVAQANVKALGDAPASALGNLYQATAQALANAAHNATTAQQQILVIAEATAAKGVAALYALDPAAPAAQIQQRLSEPVNAIKAAAPLQALASTPEVRLPIRQMVDGADATDEVAYGMRTTVVAFAASLDALGAAAQHNLLRVLQIAATSACLRAMIAQPEKASCYEEVLAAIKKLS